MELRDLHYFALVAEHGNLHRAADAIGISQPALSKALRRLEKTAGTKIATRTSTGVEVTAMGRVLLAHARRLQRGLDDALKEIADLNGGRAGSVRIGANYDAAEYVLPAACARLMAQSPDVTLKILAGTNDDLMPALREGALDVVVTGVPLLADDVLVQEPLTADRFVVCAAASHRLAGRQRISLNDLAGERWALAPAGVLSWQHVHRVFADAGLPPPRVAVETNLRSVALNAVLQSGMLAFIPQQDLHTRLTRHRLTALPVPELAWTRQLGVSYRRDAYLPPAARLLIRLLEAASGEPDPTRRALPKTSRPSPTSRSRSSGTR